MHVLKVGSFGGRLGFFARKLFPRACSRMYLSLMRINKSFEKKYIDSICNDDSAPLFHINLETINRCNGTCPFCPNNKYIDKRAPHRMDEVTFRKIISDLRKANYSGVLSLQGNGEPFLDKDLPDRIVYAREQLPNAHLIIFTNGTLLNEAILGKIAGKLDEIIVNNYSEKYELTASSKLMYNFVKNNQELFAGTSVTIDIRYKNEILSNRGGKSPNNKNTEKIYRSRCILPYMETFIFSDGTVGLCCCDVEKTFCFGNVNENSIFDIFNCEQLKDIRRKMKNGRDGIDYCKFCDFESKNKRRKNWVKLYSKK